MSAAKTDPGALNRRLVLEAPVETPDSAGGVTRSFSAVATLWAAVETASARGDVSAASLGAAILYRIRIRHRAGVTLRHRLREGSRIYRIVSIRDSDKRFLDIDAEERAD
jgi:SPP1 family predicted phage head-tail adaptor